MKKLTELLLGLALGFVSLHLFGQTYPNRTVKIITAYAPGSSTDIIARHFADGLSKAMKQSFIVENRGGAGGNIGTAMAARAVSDGYTLLMGTAATHAMNPYLFRVLEFDPIKDFEPIALAGLVPVVIAASPSFAANNIQELVAAAKKRPNEISIAVMGSTQKVVFELLVLQSGAPLYGIPYKGSPTAIADILGGQIPLTIDAISVVKPLIAAGKLKALGITSLKSSELLPGVMSVAEQGVPGFEVAGWQALFAPKGVPQPIADKLHDESAKFLSDKQTHKLILELGMDPTGPLSRAQLSQFMQAELQKWGTRIRAAKIEQQ